MILCHLLNKDVYLYKAVIGTNPILADVMAQLDYMEKRGSGLKRICNETKALEGYKDDLKPVFKSTTSQFMTIIYSVEYDTKGNEIIAKPEINKEQVVTKQSLSNHQVVVKLSLSLPNIGELLRKELLPRCKVKIYEGPNTEYKLIIEQHLLYSNIFNMKDEGDGLGLAMMRDIKFYYPADKDFRYVKLVVDRMEQIDSDSNSKKEN